MKLFWNRILRQKISLSSYQYLNIYNYSSKSQQSVGEKKYYLKLLNL